MTKHLTDIGDLYSKLTSGTFFDPGRNRTKQAIENVLKGIHTKISPTDASFIVNLDLCAPPRDAMYQVLPVSEHPTLWFGPEMETCEDPQQIELAIATGFAKGIQIARGTDPADLKDSTNALLYTWGYEVPARAGVAA